jgi:hypothetical protein
MSFCRTLSNELTKDVSKSLSEYYKNNPEYQSELRHLIEVVAKYMKRVEGVERSHVSSQYFIYRTITGDYSEELNKVVTIAKSFRIVDKLGDTVLDVVKDIAIKKATQVPWSEPRVVTKTSMNDEVRTKVEMKQITAIHISDDCVWIIEPPIYSLTSKIEKLASSKATVEEVQELVDNVIARHTAKFNKTEAPPKMIPSYIDLNTIPKISLAPHSREDELKKLGVGLIRRLNDIVVLENYEPIMLKPMNKKVTTLMRVDKIEEVAGICLRELRAEREKYLDYKAKLNQ